MWQISLGFNFRSGHSAIYSLVLGSDLDFSSFQRLQVIVQIIQSVNFQSSLPATFSRSPHLRPYDAAAKDLMRRQMVPSERLNYMLIYFPAPVICVFFLHYLVPKIISDLFFLLQVYIVFSLCVDILGHFWGKKRNTRFVRTIYVKARYVWLCTCRTATQQPR